MPLDKQVILIDAKDIQDAFEKANIKKSDLKNPVIENNIIIDITNPGKISILEEDGRIRKYVIPLHVPSIGNRKVLAYDESIQKFALLQGNVVFTSHSLIEADESDYDYSCQLTAYFLTRARKYESVRIALVSDQPEREFKEKYLLDRYNFLLSHTTSNSLLFIDGPLIGSQSSSKNIELANELLKRDVIPVFYVKNSYSRMLIDNIVGDLKHDYDSDLDFVNKFLKVGERTSFVLYQDATVHNNQKVFCYVKAYDGVPQRFEMYPNAFSKYSDKMEEIISMIYYYSLLHGDLSNPQIRPIAIAERFARESLNYIPPHLLIQTVGLDETMNARRGVV